MESNTQIFKKKEEKKISGDLVGWPWDQVPNSSK